MKLATGLQFPFKGTVKLAFRDFDRQVINRQRAIGGAVGVAYLVQRDERVHRRRRLLPSPSIRGVGAPMDGLSALP